MTFLVRIQANELREAERSSTDATRAAALLETSSGNRLLSGGNHRPRSCLPRRKRFSKRVAEIAVRSRIVSAAILTRDSMPWETAWQRDSIYFKSHLGGAKVTRTGFHSAESRSFRSSKSKWTVPFRPMRANASLLLR